MPGESRADPEEGAQGRTPTPFCVKFFKKSPKLAKKTLGRVPEPPALPPITNPGSAPENYNKHFSRTGVNFVGRSKTIWCCLPYQRDH